MKNFSKNQSLKNNRDLRSIESFPSLKILGSRIRMIDIKQIVDIMDNWISNKSSDIKCRQIVITGFHGLWVAHQNARYREIVNGADLWVPDSVAPAWIARLKGMKSAVRTPGADIMSAYFKLADSKGFRSFFYGDTEQTLEALRKKIEDKYPGHIWAGAYSPPFRDLTSEEDEKIVNMINDSKPDVVWVGLGTPKQDIWIYEHKDRLNAPIAAGVGAAFGFHAGTVKRAPEWIGNIGFEWLWRLFKEPGKIWRRILCDGPRFLWHVSLELFGFKKYKY